MASQVPVNLLVDEECDTLDKLSFRCAKDCKDEAQLAKVVAKACKTNPYAGHKLYNKALKQYAFKELVEGSDTSEELKELLDCDPDVFTPKRYYASCCGKWVYKKVVATGIWSRRVGGVVV